MQKEVLTIAGFHIGIEIPEGLRELHYSSEYLAEASPDFVATITEEDIKKELALRTEAGMLLQRGLPERERASVYSAFFRKVASLLPEHGAFLLHGSGIAYNGEGIIFSAISGTGKSTFSASWKRCFADEVEYVNDDKPFVRIQDGKVYLCGSPWKGKHQMGKNIAVPLKAVGFLERAEVNSIEKASRVEAFEELQKHAYLPENALQRKKMLDLLLAMTGMVEFYTIRCNQAEDACIPAKKQIFG